MEAGQYAHEALPLDLQGKALYPLLGISGFFVPAHPFSGAGAAS